MLFFIVSAAVLAGAALAQGEAGCQRQTISMLMSPDDAWVALVHEDICSDGYFVTTVTDTVQLVRRDTTDAVVLAWHADEPKHDNDVFALDEHGHPENRPLTRWLSSQKLQITIPNKSTIGLQKSGYEGIEIVLNYEPDDPTEREQWLNSRAAERERWLKSLGESPK